MILGKKMKNTKEMITVKEYCKKYKITDAAVRKQINQKKLNSLIYQEFYQNTLLLLLYFQQIIEFP